MTGTGGRRTVLWAATVRAAATLVAVTTLVVAATLLTPAPAAAQATLRVLAYNIKHGQGMDGRVDLERAAEVIRRLDPDVVTLQEVDRGVERTGGVDQARRLGELTGMEAVFGPFMAYDGGEYGMAVLSRLPVLRRVNHRLPDGAEPRSALEVRVGVGPERRQVAVVGIHLYRTPEERLAQAEALAAALSDESDEALPVVLAGDFNSPPDSRVLARLEDAGWSVLPKDGPRATFPADAPDREIDYVMLRPAGAFEVVEHRVVDEPRVSDHRPVLAVLRMW